MAEGLYRIEENIGWITFDRPEVGNPIDLAFAARLGDALRAAEEDREVRCVVLRGSGRHFSVGGDVKYFAESLKLQGGARQRVYEDILAQTIPAFRRIATMPKPVIASVQGAVAGAGLSLVGACDLAIAASDAFFTMAFSRIGATPDSGASYVLAQLASPKKAAELIMLGNRFDAAQALSLELVNWVCPPDELEARTRQLAQQLADGPTRAFGRSKALLHAARRNSLDAQLQAEAAAFMAGSIGEEFEEGLRSFLDKRAPDFRSVT